MSENWNASEHFEDNRTSGEIIRDRVEMLGAVFNRKVTEQLIAVFQDTLTGYPVSALKKAFTKAEGQLERFPTPKIMKLMCNEEMPSGAWKYHYRDAEGKDPETGRPIRIKIDPETGEKLYRAGDCPEGRAFLEKLASIAGREK